jgi:hypothetical protein
MSKKIDVPSKAELVELYQTLTLSQIAIQFAPASYPTVRKWFIAYGIPLKTHQQSCNERASQRIGTRRKKQTELLDDKDWLTTQLTANRYNFQMIARDLGVSGTIVRTSADKFGLFDVRDQSKLDMIEQAAVLYNANNKVSEVGSTLGVSQATISRWLDDNDVITRKPNSYPRTFNRISKAQQEIADFIVTIGDYQAEQCNRALIGVELDIIVPSAMLAIEVNGIYYHTEEFKPGRNYHLNKTTLANCVGYSLFHVYDYQWHSQKSIVMSMIRHKLGKTATKVYARQCRIGYVDSVERMKFFERNHIQGKDSASTAIGLYHNDILVCCASFRVPRFSKRYDWELVRFASLLDTAVVGGFSRAFKYFRDHHPGSIVSYSDREYSDGKLYQVAGFRLEATNPPSYYYYDGRTNIRFSRTMFTKRSLIKKTKISDHSLTESQLAKIAGLKRIWNCGTLTWVVD